MKTITLPQPDDFHVHLRDGEALKLTVPHASEQFSRITVMPNLQPAINNTDNALAYLERIKAHIPDKATLTPLITLYLTPDLTVDELAKAKAAGICAVKLYPQGVTTNSAQGISDLASLDSIFAAMAELGLLLLIHGEVADPTVDIFNRETLFVKETLTTLVKRHPNLKIVLEHITTEAAADFVLAAPNNVAATITPQHLLANRNHLLSGGIKPHYYCLPILKKESDRRALLKAATSANPKFFLGTDSAPHATHSKENACGCAGCYSMANAISYYAEAFASVDKLATLADFASTFGADFYGLPRNQRQIQLINEPLQIADSYPYLDGTITPLMAGQILSWRSIPA